MLSIGAAKRRNLVEQARPVSMQAPLKAFLSTNLDTIGSAFQVIDHQYFFGGPEDFSHHAVSPFFVAEMSQEDQKRAGLG